MYWRVSVYGTNSTHSSGSIPSPGGKPSLGPMGARVVRGARECRMTVHPVEQAAQVGGAEADVVLRLEQGLGAGVSNAGRSRGPPAGRRQDLHEPESAGR